MNHSDYIRSQFFRAAWRDLARLAPESLEPRVSIESLRQTEWSTEFEQLMRNRLVQGAFRYGLLYDRDRSKHDCIASMRRRLDDYETAGNLEKLVDVANLAMVEFERSDHPLRHFQACGVDSAEHHAKEK